MYPAELQRLWQQQQPYGLLYWIKAVEEQLLQQKYCIGTNCGFIGVVMLFAEQINIAGDASQRLLNLVCMILLIWVLLHGQQAHYILNMPTAKYRTENGEDLHVMVKLHGR